MASNEPSKHSQRMLHTVWRHTRRVLIAIAGIVVILAGIAISVPGIPGPGFLVIAAGFAILALEFPWAERLLRRAKVTAKRYYRRWFRLRPKEDRHRPDKTQGPSAPSSEGPRTRSERRASISRSWRYHSRQRREFPG